MSTQVLIVDDNVEFARRAARLVTARTELVAEYTADPATACAIVERQPVAVAVLDERMPQLAGTALFPKLKKIRPELRVLMLSGEAGADEVGMAFELGYNGRLSKGRISDLPERVQQEYIQYLTESSVNLAARPEIVWPRRRRFGLQVPRLLRRTEILLISIEELAAPPIDADAWTTVLQLNVGEERKLVYQLASTTSLTIERASQEVLKGVLNLKARPLAALASSIEASAMSSSRRSHSATQVATRSMEQTFQLPTSDDPSNARYVRARHFQQAILQRKFLVTLRVRCRCCGIYNIVPIVVLQNTDKIATRHLDYLNDNSETLVNTGTVAATDVQVRPSR
jgi:CheY-like chemotaxis protein